jgi:endonuclease/exonuclease/phosphatase family metal-dependent hydrolase
MQNPNGTRVKNLLEKQNLDLIGLQEVTYDKHNPTLEKLAKSLNMHFTFGLGCWGEGLAFLSKSPIITTQNHVVRISQRDGRNITRIEIGTHQDTSFYVVHLDHILEQTRLDQLENINHVMFEKDQNKVQIVIGDFNALCLKDYTPDYLRKINEVRKYGAWEKAYGKVYDYMTQLGFVDCFKTMNSAVHDEELKTCRYDTRIDYIWIRGHQDAWKIVSCEIIDSEECTDHQLVVATFDC